MENPPEHRSQGSDQHAGAVPASGSPWFVSLGHTPEEDTSNKSHAVVCFPYAGTGQSVFAGWRHFSFPAGEFFAVQLPGRDGRRRETPIESADELSSQVASAIVQGELGDRKITLLGCSFGGLLAFEVARKLRDQGHPVHHLVVAASRAPQMIEVTEPVSDLPDQEMMDRLHHWYGAVPAEIMANPEMLALVVPIVRADMRVYETYQYRDLEPLTCAITAVGGSEDRVVTLNHLQGWRSQTAAGFACRQFSGDHFFVKTRHEPVLRFITRKIQA